MIAITKCPLALILNKIVTVLQCIKTGTLCDVGHFVSVVKYRESHCVTVLVMYDVHSETSDLLAQNGSVISVPTKHTIPHTDHSRRGQVGLETIQNNDGQLS